MKREENELSYFAIRLREVIHSSFPEILADNQFIEDRAAAAATAYEREFLAGYPQDDCLKTALEILFKDLHFSKFDTIFQVVCQEFNSLMLDEELRPFALKMLPQCLPIFDKFIITDDFAYSYEFDALYAEIRKVIEQRISDHGL